MVSPYLLINDPEGIGLSAILCPGVIVCPTVTLLPFTVISDPSGMGVRATPTLSFSFNKRTDPVALSIIPTFAPLKSYCKFVSLPQISARVYFFKLKNKNGMMRIRREGPRGVLGWISLPDR